MLIEVCLNKNYSLAKLLKVGLMSFCSKW